MSKNSDTSIQSAAKLQFFEEGSETIPKGSTQCKTDCGSAQPLTDNAEGDDIVQRKKHFQQIANEKFNYKFTYYDDFVNYRKKIKITCPIHGDFYQTPSHHIGSKFSCSKCSNILKDKTIIDHERINKLNRKSISEFIERANKKYNSKYKYIIDEEKWTGITSTFIKVVCPIHGEFETLAINHVMKNNIYGCSLCASKNRIYNNTAKYDDVVNQMKQKFDNKYIYPEENRKLYKNKRTKIKIICPDHGEFLMSVSKHLSGQKCKKCSTENLIKNNVLQGGYCEHLFEELPELKNKTAFLYYLSINNGKLFKIGITTKSVKQRIRGICNRAKKFGYKLNIKEVISKETTLYEAFKTEQNILNTYSKHRVYSKYSTELFDTDIFENIKSFF